MSWVNSIEPLTDAGPLQGFPTLQEYRNGADTPSMPMYAIHAPIFQPLCKNNLLFHGDFWKIYSPSPRRGIAGGTIRVPVALR